MPESGWLDDDAKRAEHAQKMARPRFGARRRVQPSETGIPRAQCLMLTARGKPCRQYAVPGSEFCRAHGGGDPLPEGVPRSGSGRQRAARQPKRARMEASGAYKDGRYSSVLPMHLLERYRRAQSDEQLLSMSEELYLLDTRMGAVLKGLNAEASTEAWRKAKEHIRTVTGLFRRRQYAEALPLLLELQELVSSGWAEMQVWEEVGRLTDRRVRLVESERRRMLELQQYISVQRANALVTAIGGIIQQHVTDPGALHDIANDIGRLLAQQPRSQLTASGGGADPRSEHEGA